MNTSLFSHYATVAVRSLTRYKTQSVISIIGLAVGFVCLSLSTLWVNYTNHYNTRLPIPNQERVFALATTRGYDKLTPGAPSDLLRAMEEWPEVEARCFYAFQTMPAGEKMENATCLMLNPWMLDFFQFDVVSGERDFWRHIDEKSFMDCDVVLTEPYAQKMFGTENPIGKKLLVGREERDVVAVVKAFDRHSNFNFDMIALPPKRMHSFEDGYFWGSNLVKLSPGKEAKASFEKKIDEFVLDGEPLHARMLPIRKLAQWMPASLSYDHQRTFLLISILVVVCALVNYLTLYLNRLRSRKREMALRMVYGSSRRNLMGLFAVELLVVLGSATLLGMAMVYGLKDAFAGFASMPTEGGHIMQTSLLIMLATLMACLFLSVISVEVVRRRTLSSSINPVAARRQVFSSVSVGVQLAVSLCFVFCAVVMLRQLWVMKNTDLGIAIKDRASLIVTYDFISDTNDADVLIDGNGIPQKLEAIPEIEEVYRGWNFYTQISMLMGRFDVSLNPESDSVKANSYAGLYDPGNPIYGFSVLEGELPRYETWNPSEIVISESVRDQLGLKEALGVTLHYNMSTAGTRVENVGTVIAVVRDISLKKIKATDTPTPFIMSQTVRGKGLMENNIIMSYHHGKKKEVETKIKEMMASFPSMVWNLSFADDLHNEQIKSEENLSHLLTVVTCVAILIAVFGVYSIITLACRQRRKEIALRKIHGAKLKDILGMFVREYGIILVISSFVAFVVGFLIMHGWLEQYLKRITIGPQFYLGIFVATALLIALCVGSRVWRTARENPADVIKSE